MSLQPSLVNTKGRGGGRAARSFFWPSFAHWTPQKETGFTTFPILQEAAESEVDKAGSP